MSLPRVTEILGFFTQFHNVPGDVLQKAAARGTAVHAICAGIAQGLWVPDTFIDAEHAGYVESFEKWKLLQVDSFELVEKRLADTDLGYTGQIDFVIKGKDGDLYLVDIKTSARPQKTYPVQLAAYENLLRRIHVKVKACVLVYLARNGDYPEIHMLDNVTKEFEVFTSALECYYYFNRRKDDDSSN